jgi:hypothetical protein
LPSFSREQKSARVIGVFLNKQRLYFKNSRVCAFFPALGGTRDLLKYKYVVTDACHARLGLFIYIHIYLPGTKLRVQVHFQTHIRDAPCAKPAGMLKKAEYIL